MAIARTTIVALCLLAAPLLSSAASLAKESEPAVKLTAAELEAADTAAFKAGTWVPHPPPPPPPPSPRYPSPPPPSPPVTDPCPIRPLIGKWKTPNRGWNMIALPIDPPAAPFRYRLMMNQYEEEFSVFGIDKNIPNRGITINGFSDPPPSQGGPDQFICALDYTQIINQIAVEDFPPTNVSITGLPGLGIHHENGMFLHIKDERTEDINIARQGSIPHGNAIHGLGTSRVIEGPFVGFDVGPMSGLPIGVNVPDVLPPVNPTSPRYLDPYSFFANAPFHGVVPLGTPGFSGFSPVNPQQLLNEANAGIKFKRIHEFVVDTRTLSGGVNNIPFVVKQAESSSMKSTFWVQELEEKDDKGRNKMRLQYLQVVILEFFGRTDGHPGRIIWPHVSINTMDRVF